MGVVYAGGGVSQYAVPVEVLADLIADTGAFNADTSCEPPAGSPLPESASACGANVFAGPQTSCPFALNVEAGWRQAGGGSVRFKAFSPVTKLEYDMRCQDDNPVVCRAQTSAIVYIKL